MITRVCKKCGENKPIDEYWRDKDGLDGYFRRCKTCLRAEQKARQEKIPLAERKAAKAAHYSANRERYRENSRRTHLRIQYGITLEIYNQMKDAQSGVCAICARPQLEGRALHVDHDHTTGRVRALLCHNCNAMVGMAKEDPFIIWNALQYIDKYSGKLRMSCGGRPYSVSRIPKPALVEVEGLVVPHA